MKGRISLVVGIAAVLSACDSAVPTPSEPISLEPVFAASTGTNNISVPVALGAFVPCANGGAGEIVNLSGDLHILTHTTISSSGNLITKTHTQPQGISGTGATTGDQYQGTGVTQETVHGTGTFTFVNNFRIVGQGADNNLLIHNNLHVTINANGDVTAVVDNLSIECR